MIPSMNNPYPNPYLQYQQPYSMPQNNPYLDRLNNLQQYQQSLQQPQQTYLGGKVVDSIDVVKATDIPMDGKMYYFPKADGSEVYSKNWLPDGTTRILTFKPVLEAETNISSSEVEKRESEALGAFREEIMGRLDGLNESLNNLSKSLNKNSRAKREADAE